MSKLFSLLICFLPSFIKIPIYRYFLGYRIGKRVRIGFSPFIDVQQCHIMDGVRIGHFNAFVQVQSLVVGRHTHIGTLNVIRGGNEVLLGAYVTLLRMNVLNSIPEAEAVNERHPVLRVGDGVTITTMHWLDFTDTIEVGAHTIIGGRSSSLWTHNRQRMRPIRIGHHCYIGSEARFAPGSNVGPFNIVALGSVVINNHERSFELLGGNPAASVRTLEDRDIFLLVRKTRSDIPNDIAAQDLPADLRTYMEGAESAIIKTEISN